MKVWRCKSGSWWRWRTPRREVWIILHFSHNFSLHRHWIGPLLHPLFSALDWIWKLVPKIKDTLFRALELLSQWFLTTPAKLEGLLKSWNRLWPSILDRPNFDLHTRRDRLRWSGLPELISKSVNHDEFVNFTWPKNHIERWFFPPCQSDRTLAFVRLGTFFRRLFAWDFTKDSKS
jgi:hypothetical protein